MSRTAIWAILAIAIVGTFTWKYLSLNAFGPSDQKMIREALDQAVLASREGRPGGVMDYLSNKFAVNSESITSGQVANFIKNGIHITAALRPTPEAPLEPGSRVRKLPKLWAW